MDTKHADDFYSNTCIGHYSTDTNQIIWFQWIVSYIYTPHGDTIVNVFVLGSGRMQFMLDIITSLRTNNPQKIPGYDPDRIETMRKLLKTHIKSNKYIIKLIT